MNCKSSVEMNIEFLPNAHKARVDRGKIIEYLLSQTHPDGRAKAAFFTELGFTIEKWEVLAESLRTHGRANPVVKAIKSKYGVRYCVEGPIETPAGISPNLRSVWVIEEGVSEPRLITAYPV